MLLQYDTCRNITKCFAKVENVYFALRPQAKCDLSLAFLLWDRTYLRKKDNYGRKTQCHEKSFSTECCLWQGTNPSSQLNNFSLGTVPLKKLTRRKVK